MPNSAHNRSDLAWSWAMALYLGFFLLAGGTSSPESDLADMQLVAAILLLGPALWRLRNGFPGRHAAAGGVLAALALACVAIQLVPLPPSIWMHVPGRETVFHAAVSAGADAGWHPLSLAPEATRQAGLFLLPAIAGFVGSLSLLRRQLWPVVLVVLACAAASIMLGIAQRLHGSDGSFYLYESSKGLAAGTFNNRNFFGTQLFAAIPFVAALAAYGVMRWRIHGGIAVLAVISALAFIMAGLAASASRAAILMAMLAIVLSVFVARPALQMKPALARSGFAMLALLAMLVVLGQAGLLRLSQADLSSEYRPTIQRITLQAAKAHFPAGSGYGSFVPVYQMHESPGDVIEVYANHAHSDWLELALEGGAPAVALMGLFLIWLARGVIEARGWRDVSPAVVFRSAAGASLLLILGHSLVDYPLRTPAMLVFFAVCCGLWALPYGQLVRGAAGHPHPRLAGEAPRHRVAQFGKRGAGTLH